MNDPARILVVDDEDAGRFVKAQTLRRAGFTVLEGVTGTEAMDLAVSENLDLIVLDVHLPDISGLEVAKRLRSSDRTTALPILQVSSTAVSSADRVRGLEQGADVYLTEPVDGVVLVATVNALLRARKAELALAGALERERQARRLAEQPSQLKDEFIATLSHELRTPLNALMGWIWQLRHTTLGEEARTRALDSLERNAQMQAQLINDLLDVSRVSKGKLQLHMRLVDLKAVVLAATEFVREAIERKHLTLKQDLTSVWAAADQARMQQIATNLLTNAIQFTPNDGRVTVSLSAESGDAVLTVEDTGAGIDAEFLPHVFDQFRQAEGGLSRKHGGLGLGLTVVKQLIDLHAGSVTVASAGIGQGATFTVRLPAEAAPVAERRAGDALLLKEAKILIVTDGTSDSSILKSALESSGAQVAVAAPADDLATSHAGEFDLLIADPGANDQFVLRAPGSGDAHDAQSISRSTKPSDIVRRVARTMSARRTS